MYTIYLITNKINGDSYIGFTRRDPGNRWNEHLRQKGPWRLHRALRKYGRNNFSFEILEQGENEIYGHEVAESLYIRWLKPKYNMTHGGDGVLGLQEESIVKMRLAKLHIGRKAETKKKISATLKGRRKTEKHKINAAKGHSLSWNITTPSGEEIIIDNLNNYCKINNLKQSNMSFVANGKRKHHKNFKVKLVKE